MANPERHDDRELRGLRRANRDDEQHWRDKGWETIEGGRDRVVPTGAEAARNEEILRDDLAQDAPMRTHHDPVIGADYTRSPFDPSLARDEQGRLREDRTDVVHGYGENSAERNYPRAYDRDELVNTDLNPAMEYPHKTSATFRILAVVGGLVLFGLLIALMYWNFLAPVRRTPEGPNGKVQQQKVQTTAGLQQFAAFVSRANERR